MKIIVWRTFCDAVKISSDDAIFYSDIRPIKSAFTFKHENKMSLKLETKQKEMKMAISSWSDRPTLRGGSFCSLQRCVVKLSIV